MKTLNLLLLSFVIHFLSFSFGFEYNLELQQAYNWSFRNKITTMDSIEGARLSDGLTREEMAKMISNYAVDILGKVPDTTKPCYFLDSNINPDLVQYVTISCQLGLMGQGITSFRPKDFVTRAEFGTVLSRMLWGNEYEGGKLYYENHLRALNVSGIMKNISYPFNNEIRGYVMLMLMRSVGGVDDDIVNNNQISDVLDLLD